MLKLSVSNEGLVPVSKLMETQNGHQFTHRCFYKKAFFVTQYRSSSSRLCVDTYSSAGQRMSEHCTVIIFFSVWAWHYTELFLCLLLSMYPLLPVSWVPCITTVYILYPSFFFTYDHFLMSTLTVLKEKQVKSVMVWNQSCLISWWGFDWSHYFSRSWKLLVPHTKKRYPAPGILAPPKEKTIFMFLLLWHLSQFFPPSSSTIRSFRDES